MYPFDAFFGDVLRNRLRRTANSRRSPGRTLLAVEQLEGRELLSSVPIISQLSKQFGHTLLGVEQLGGRELLSSVPIISQLSKQFDNENSSLAVNFVVSDGAVPPSTLTITATSDNVAVIPNTGLSILGSAAHRTLVITPTSNQVGEAQITLKVRDIRGHTTMEVVPVLVTAPVALPFTDSFRRPDSVFLGVGWQEDLGHFAVKSDHGLAANPQTALATLDGVFAADVAVQADVTVGAGQSAGLVARYSGPTDHNYYLGQLTKIGSNVQAQLFRNFNGIFTMLASQPVSTTGSGTLRFEVAGPSLKLFLNNTLVAFANDTILTAPGSVGVRTSGSASFDNFSAETLTLIPASLPFSDDFSTATNQQLSLNWTNQLGNFQVSGGMATGHGALNVAVVNGISAADVAIEADANVTGAVGRFAGLVARYSGPKDQNLYLGRLVNTGSGFKAELIRNFNGILTILVSQPVSTAGIGTLRFEVAGPSLKLFLNNTLVAFADDSQLTTGTVGIDTSAGATVDNFSAETLTLIPASLPFSDDFSTATNQQLSLNWTNQLGNFQVSGGMATGHGALNVATVNGISTADVAIEADANVTGAVGQSAGLVARYSGPTDHNYYLGQLTKIGSNVQAQLFRNFNGIFTMLASQPVSTTGSGTLRFEVAGPSLKLFLNNTLVAFANDTILTAPGSVGVRTSGSASFDNFSAETLTLIPASLPFSDDFSTATNQQLSLNWTNQLGNFQVSGGMATGHGALNVAVVNGISAADVAIEADANVTGAVGRFAGLVARYSGPKDQNLYLGRLVNTGSGFKAELIRNFNGILTILVSQPVSTAGIGTLRFEVAGPSLKLFLNNTLVAFADDSQLTTGTVGIDTSAGATVDNFSAETLTLIPASLPFSDDFSTATNQQLSLNWTNQLGNFQVSGGMATGHGALNVATVNGISTADVAIEADANVTGAVGQSAGLVARYSGPGNQNMYFGGLFNTGAGFQAQIWRNVNGIWTKLASQPVAAGFGNLRLATVGTSLMLAFNGIQVLSITDTHISAAGSVGMRASLGAALDNFQTSVVPH